MVWGSGAVISSSREAQRMDHQHIQEFVTRGNEVRGVEFKAAGTRTDRAFLVKVVRAALAMSNRRDGGTLILGVADGPPPVIEGLTAEQLATWSFDDLSASFAEYAEPNIQFEVDHVDVSGKFVVAISVHEFDQVPVICKKDYPNALRRGAVYVRGHRMPESVELPGYAEMRDLLDLATEKGVRSFVATAQRAGLAVSHPAGVSPFDAELGDYA